MTDPDTVLSVRDLRVVRGRREVLSLPSLDLGVGERLAVVGPNGAGKSTLLEVLALLRRPGQGEVCFMGRAVSWEHGELVRLRRRLAVVFQRPLLLHGTLLDNVALGARLRGEPAVVAVRSARRWLEALGIAHLAARRSTEVSVGEAQRASIARALATAPEVLLLDEPFTALDSLARYTLMDTFEQILHEQRCAVALVTHDWREVRRLAGRVVVLFAGHAVQIGGVSEIENGPATPEVAALIGAAS